MEQTLLQVDGLTKQYGNFTLDHVSFSVPGGSIMGFVGENGAGKTTTLKLILDELSRDSGTVRVFGQDNREHGSVLRARIGVVFDDCHFHEMFTPAEVGAILRGCYKSWDDGLYDSLLRRFGLPKKEKEDQGAFPRHEDETGRCGSVAHRPRLLLLDEATSGLIPLYGTRCLNCCRSLSATRSTLYSSRVISPRIWRRWQIM